MIKLIQGDLLKQDDVDAIVNAVMNETQALDEADRQIGAARRRPGVG